MNQSQLIEADLAYLACLIDTRASLCVKGHKRLQLTIRVRRHQLAYLPKFIESLGFKYGDVREALYCTVTVLDAEVGKLFSQVHPHLRSELAKKYASLAFRYWRTAQKQGIKLTPEQKEERLAVERDIRKLRTEPAVS